MIYQVNVWLRFSKLGLYLEIYRIDWCFVETLGTGSYDFNGYRTATDVELKIMRERSPVFHMENIVAPTLLCLGAKDRRVPYSQGIDFYHMLKAKGVPTRYVQ